MHSNGDATDGYPRDMPRTPRYGGKSVEFAQAERARATVRELVRERFDGNATAAASAMGGAQPTLSEFLNGNRGPGVKLLNGISRVTGLSMDRLLHGDTPPATGAVGGPTVSQIEGWAEAVLAARDALPDLPGWVFRKLGSVHGLDVPVPVTVDFVTDMAVVLWRHTPPEEKIERENAVYDAHIKRLKTRATNKIGSGGR